MTNNPTRQKTTQTAEEVKTLYSSQTYTEIVREFMKDVKTLLCAYGVQADRSLYSTIECMVCNAITEATIITAHATDAT